MLGAFMWLDDPQLLERIEGFHRPGTLARVAVGWATG
jgi:hypothetical protein